MTRKALPQYYINKGTLYEDFSAVGDFSIGGGETGNFSADSEYVTEGNSSLKITTLSGRQCIVQKTINESFTNKTEMYMRVYIPKGELAKLNYLDLFLTSENQYSAVKNFRRNFSTSGHYYLFKEGWNTLPINTSLDWQANGGIEWTELMKNLALRVVPVTGQVVTVIFDALFCGIKSVPKVLLTFDDGYESQYTNAYPAMKERGIKATHYMIKDNVDTAGYMTESQMTEMYTNGYAMSVHQTSPTTNFYSMTYEQIYYEINTCCQWLLGLGFARSAAHMAYPGGQNSATAMQVTKDLGFKTGRTVRGNTLYHVGSRTYYDMNGLNIDLDTSLDTAKSAIDEAITKGTAASLFFHKVDNTGQAYTWTMANFEALLDYILERKIKCLTIDEWYEGLTNPRYRSLPLGRATV